MASVFGLSNLLSRPAGGILSDVMFRRFGFRGRVWLQFAVLFLEAVFLFAFGSISDEQPVELAAAVLFIFSVFCEMGCGTSYGVVPFINKQQMAVVSAVVGAGGNLGAVIATQAFYKPMANIDELMPYKVHAAYVLVAALLTPVFYWPEHGGMFWGPAEAAAGEKAGPADAVKGAALPQAAVLPQAKVPEPSA